MPACEGSGWKNASAFILVFGISDHALLPSQHILQNPSTFSASPGNLHAMPMTAIGIGGEAVEGMPWAGSGFWL